MSSVILETFSQSSKAYKLGYILLGYSITFLFVPLKHGGDPTTYLITVAITGGFIGTFLVFLKPLKIALHYFYSKDYEKKHSRVLPASVYYSPFLSEYKGEIIDGILFSLTCLVALFNSNFNLLSYDNVWIIRIGLIIIGLSIIWITYRRYNRLKRKFSLLEVYYEQVELMTYKGKSLKILDYLRLALNRKDWEEAFTIEKQYNKIIKEEKEIIFKEGYGKNSGLGLHLVKLMCEVYGWTINETGTQGKGAQFTITIPKNNYVQN